MTSQRTAIARRASRPARAHLLALLVGALVAAPAHAAGTVVANFVQPERYTDIGFAAADRDRAMATLRAHLERRGRDLLADGQSLQVDVLDVDLAGREHPGARRDLRVLDGRVDAPRLHLRYTLRAGERVLASGAQQLTDAAYLDRLPPRRALEPLAHERRLLDGWLAARLAPAALP